MRKFAYTDYCIKRDALCELYGITPETVIRIEDGNFSMEIPYINLLLRPPYPYSGLKSDRNHQAWVKRVIKLASKHGGWKLIHK